MMTNRLILFLILTQAVSGCKNNSIMISGKLENPVKGEYLYLEELKKELVTIDSLKIREDGKFSFKIEATLPTFYLLKINNNKMDNIELDDLVYTYEDYNTENIQELISS